MKRQSYHITPENIKFIKERAKKKDRSEGYIVNQAIEKLRNGS